jgi:hypothetical protein
MRRILHAEFSLEYCSLANLELGQQRAQRAIIRVVTRSSELGAV